MTRTVRILVACFMGLSLVLTWVAIREGVAHRFGGSGSRDLVARDSVIHGTGISTPLVALLTFAVLVALTWVPGRWRAVPLFLLAALAGVGLFAAVAEVQAGGGPFSHELALLAVIIWGASLGVALAIVVAAVLAGIAALRRETDEP